MNKNKICLILRNNPGWQGGSEYIKNILFSFSYLKKSDREKIELYFISFDNSFDFNLIKNYCDYFYSFSKLQNPILKKFFLRNSNSKILQFIFILYIIFRNNINFVFPFPNYLFFLGVKSALWIPDFQHHHLSKFFSDNEIHYRNKKFKEIIKYSSNLILSSKDCFNDLKKFYGQPKKRVFIINFRANLNKDWLKLNPNLVVKKYNLPEKYFIISNQFWKHKNHLLVFKSLNYLRETERIIPNLVLTGKLFNGDDKFAFKIIESIKKYNIENKVYMLGLIPKKDQFLLIRKSIAIIQPSLFEGWSTIVEESRSIGKEIILSDLNVHKEQNYERSIFFKKNSYKELAELIFNFYKKLDPGPDLIIEDFYANKHNDLMREFAKKIILISKS